MGFLGFGKKTYYVNFEWDDIALETSTHIDASNEDEALEKGREYLDNIPEDRAGTWSVEVATDLPRRKFFGLF